MKDIILNTFQLVNNNNIISPSLVTIRQYGNWFQQTFDEYTSQMELYMKSKKNTGESVLEWHPGTRIGKWFDSHNIDSPKYKSWYVMRQCSEKMTLKFACILSRASGKMQGNFYLFLGGSPPCLPHILGIKHLICPFHSLWSQNI